MRALGITLFAVLIGAAAPVAAQCGRDVRRPVEDLFLSDVVFPQEKHEVQLEMIPSVARVPGGSVSAVGAAWEYGLTDAWQIQGAWDGPARRRVGNDSTTTTFSGASVGAKRSFMCLGGSPYDASIGLDFERGDDRSSAKPAFIVGRDFGDQAAHLFASAVADIPFTRPLSPGSTVTLGFFARLAPKRIGEWRGSTEVSFTSGGSQTSTWLFAPGLLWHSPDAWEFGAGYAVSMTGRAGHQLRTHIVYEFGGDK
jgi:hypothetical protein